MPSFTSGPWRVENLRTVWGGYGFFQKLAELEGCIEEANLDTSLADLRLIAAAPEYDNLAREYVAHFTRNGGCSNCGGERHTDSCFVARFMALIAKAEGK